jgi:hypothetical protein
VFKRRRPDEQKHRHLAATDAHQSAPVISGAIPASVHLITARIAHGVAAMNERGNRLNPARLE